MQYRQEHICGQEVTATMEKRSLGVLHLKYKQMWNEPETLLQLPFIIRTIGK